MPPSIAADPRAPLLESIGTALPGPGVPQSAIRDTAADALRELAPQLLEKLSVFETVGIRKRHLVRPLDWYLESHGWAERSQIFAEEGLALAEAAARDALARADLPAHAIDGIVFVTTTGVATPSLDAPLLDRMGFRRDVQRYPVWGLGCAGGVAGLNLATRLGRSQPDKRFLLITMETCSLAFHLTDFSIRAFVAATLFADGAAAAVIRGADVEGARLGRLGPGASHTWPDTRNVMGWDISDEGLHVVFSRRIPDLIASGFAPVVHSFLKENGIDADRGGGGGGGIDRFVFHPGGTKVLDAYETSLSQPREAFDVSREVLRDHGNMSSPTVLFVLRDALAQRPLAPGERALLAALGPGFSGELALLEG